MSLGPEAEAFALELLAKEEEAKEGQAAKPGPSKSRRGSQSHLEPPSLLSFNINRGNGSNESDEVSSIYFLL